MQVGGRLAEFYWYRILVRWRVPPFTESRYNIRSTTRGKMSPRDTQNAPIYTGDSTVIRIGASGTFMNSTMGEWQTNAMPGTQGPAQRTADPPCACVFLYVFFFCVWSAFLCSDGLFLDPMLVLTPRQRPKGILLFFFFFLLCCHIMFVPHGCLYVPFVLVSALICIPTRVFWLARWRCLIYHGHVCCCVPSLATRLVSGTALSAAIASKCISPFIYPMYF